jgi:putative flippase GtrA
LATLHQLNPTHHFSDIEFVPEEKSSPQPAIDLYPRSASRFVARRICLFDSRQSPQVAVRSADATRAAAHDRLHASVRGDNHDGTAMSAPLPVGTGSNLTARSFVSFILVGGFATGVQYAVMSLLIWLAGYPLVLASGIGFAVSAAANYLLNARLTFRSKGSHASTLPRFIVTAVLGLALNSLLLAFLASFGMHPAAAQLLTTLGVLLWNYTINALWTFRNPTR